VIAGAYPAVKSKHAKVEPIREPTLFEMEQMEPVGALVNNLAVERSHAEPGFVLGTSAFTAAGWPGSFYPPALKLSDYLTYSASRFRTVEIDSTYYGPPAASTVESWCRKTPAAAGRRW
jgi:Protein of unknown function DUF72